MSSFHHVMVLVVALVATMLLQLPSVSAQCAPNSCTVVTYECTGESTTCGNQQGTTIQFSDERSDNVCAASGPFSYGLFSAPNGATSLLAKGTYPPGASPGVPDTDTFALDKANGKYTISFGLTDGSGDYFVVDGTSTLTLAGSSPGACATTAELKKFSFVLQVPNSQPMTPPLTSLCISACPNIAADPAFVGFHGQKYAVKGVAGEVFNLLSSPSLQLNSRFVALRQQNESITSWQMERLRNKHHRLVEEMQTGELKSVLPPITSAWGHPGTYMGECGLMLAGSKLVVQPGSYEKGFASLKLNGEIIPVSAEPIQLADSLTLVHSTPFTLDVVSPDVVFTIVNSGNFLNIERAVLVSSSASEHLSGMLGVSADRQFKAVNSADWISHMEQDFKLASGDIFGTDFATNQYVQ